MWLPQHQQYASYQSQEGHIKCGQKNTSLIWKITFERAPPKAIYNLAGHRWLGLTDVLIKFKATSNPLTDQA